jgi:hypothetical protein
MYNKKFKTTPSRYFCRPSRFHHLYPTGFKIHFHDFFMFAPAGKNVPKDEFT